MRRCVNFFGDENEAVRRFENRAGAKGEDRGAVFQKKEKAGVASIGFGEEMRERGVLRIGRGRKGGDWRVRISKKRKKRAQRQSVSVGKCGSAAF